MKKCVIDHIDDNKNNNDMIIITKLMIKQPQQPYLVVMAGLSNELLDQWDRSRQGHRRIRKRAHDVNELESHVFATQGHGIRAQEGRDRGCQRRSGVFGVGVGEGDRL